MNARTPTGFRVDTIRVRLLELPLERPFRISTGVCRVRRSVIVELASEGIIGYGESAPFDEPFYSEETISSVLALYRDLYIPRLQGKRFESIEDFDRALGQGVRGNFFARAGLETAAWDLLARARQRPLAALLGETLQAWGVPAAAAQPRERVESGVALGIPEGAAAEQEAVLAGWLAEYVRDGYRRVKLKIVPGWDVAPCAVARRELDERFPLTTDANASFDVRAHLETFKALEEFGLLYHEQPLHYRDLLDHATLARTIKTPICLDESLKSAREARQALELGSARVWNLKVQRVGGLCESLRIYTLASRSEGVALWVGTMPESGLGSQATLALASLPLFTFPSDVEPTRRWFPPDSDPVLIDMARDGTIAVPRGAGVEASIDKRLYQRYTRPMY